MTIGPESPNGFNAAPSSGMKMSLGGKAQGSKAPGFARIRGRHPLLECLDNALRGCGQVIFMNNPLTGALNLIGMFWGAFAGGTTYAVAVGSAVGALVATVAAYPLRVDRDALRMGLYGFNGMLVGAGIATFLGNTPSMWAVLVFAAAISTVVTLAVENFLKAWTTPGLTFPFVLTTWLVLLAAYKFSGLQTHGLPAATLVSEVSATSGPFGIAGFIRASLVSVGQVFFVDDPVSGTIFLIALAVHSRWCAGLAALGAAEAVASALLMGADRAMISHGLWGYSAVLTAPAIGCVFMQVSPSTLVYCATRSLRCSCKAPFSRSHRR